MSKESIVEVVRSFSFKLSLPNYQNADFFCSQKKECPESEAEKVSEQLYEFCRNQVIKNVNEYKKSIKGVKVKKSPYYEVKQEQEETMAKMSAVEGVLAEAKLKEPVKNREA